MTGTKRIGRRRAWLMDRLRLVMVPTGKRHEFDKGGQCMRPAFTSPRWVAIEATHDLRFSASQIDAAATGRARRVARWWGWAYYRMPESPAGRAASGHWLTDHKGHMRLHAIALISHPGYPIPGAAR